MTRLATLVTVAAASLLSACMSIGIGNDSATQAVHVLRDAHTASIARLDKPLVPALLIQPLPGDALVDTLSIAYSPRAHEFAFYQLATWSQQPTHQVPRLLQRRLQARGIAVAVGLLGEPLRADWLLTVGVDALYHDVSTTPGQARVALTVELFDRRSRTRVARRPFAASVPVASADSAAAAAALSLALAQAFDAVLPWLDSELQRAASRAP